MIFKTISDFVVEEIQLFFWGWSFCEVFLTSFASVLVHFFFFFFDRILMLSVGFKGQFMSLNEEVVADLGFGILFFLFSGLISSLTLGKVLRQKNFKDRVKNNYYI